MFRLREKRGPVCVAGMCGQGWQIPGKTDWLSLTLTLTPFQKSIRPQVVTTFELPGCYDMWTVIAPVRKEEVDEAGLRRKPRRGKELYI